MSNAGIFTLLTQSDIDDAYFTAFDLLQARLDSMPLCQRTTDEIEKTHLLYVKSRYYPYVSLTSEYNKIITSGCSYLTQAGGMLKADLPDYGHFTNDIVLYIKFNPIGSSTSYYNNTEPTINCPLYRYCSYPGIRLLEKVEFLSNNVVMDSYQPEDVISYKNFFVSKDHKPGWERCYGQDEIQQATYNSRSFTGVLNYSNGFQTPKLYHGAFEMFIPLHFWFCEDVSSALINYGTTLSTRRIQIQLAGIDKILQSLIYDNTGTGDIRITPSGTTIVPLGINGIKLTSALYVNQLYTQPYISDIIKSHFNFNLIRVHKRQISSLTAKSNQLIDLSQLRYPGEFLSVGFRSKQNAKDFDRWHLMGSDYLTEDANQIRSLHVPAIIWNADHNIRQLVTREATQITSLNNIVDSIEIIFNGIYLYPQELSQSFFNDYLPIRYNKNSAVVSPYDNNMFLITFCFYPGKFNPSGHFNFSNNNTDLKMNYSLTDEYGNNPDNYEIVLCLTALNFLYYNETNCDTDKNINASGDLQLRYTM